MSKRYNKLCQVGLYFGVIVIIFLSLNNSAKAGITYTVCDTGCDFPNLSSAFPPTNLAPFTGDTLQLTADYVFDPGIEATLLSGISGVTIECAAGADTFGDFAEMARSLIIGSDVTIQNCNFENTNFISLSANNIHFLNNTFSSAASSEITLTTSSNFEINDNVGIQRINIQNTDDGLIDNNTFECRFYDNCINVTTSSGIPNYTNSADIPSNINITNNTITNFRTSTLGDWIMLDAGENINFTFNTVKSAVNVDNNFNGLLTVQNAEAYIANNYFLFPFKDDTYSGTWGVNIRVTESDVTVVAEHNTFILNGTGSMLNGSSCFGVFDDETSPVPSINLQINYNLCYNPWVVAGGTGVSLNYNPATINLLFSDSYSGFYNLGTLINDTNSIFTALDATITTTDPVLRNENVNVSDDYDPVPMSRYFDVNGTNDIGAFSAVRMSDYMIDDNCLVDYVSCVSNTSTILNKVIKSDDNVEIGAGTYAPVSFTQSVSNVSINGAGASTIFNAVGGPSALYIENMSDSTISNIRLIGATSLSENYQMFSNVMSAAGIDYNQDVDGNPVLSGIFFDGSICDVTALLSAPSVDVTAIPGIGTSDIGLFLIRIPPSPPDSEERLTVFISESEIADPAQLQAVCGVPAAYVDHFIPSIFSLQPDNSYIFDSAALAAEGITILGNTNNSFIDLTETLGSGLLLENSSNNTFEGLIFDGNLLDVTANTVDNNSLINSFFDLSKIEVVGVGDLEIYYSVLATIKRASNLTPINGATVVIKNLLNAIVATLTTGVNGETPLSSPILATTISSGDPLLTTSGGFNPFTFNVSASGYNNKSEVNTIDSVFENFNINLSPTSSGGGGGGGGGGFSSTPIAIIGPTLSDVLAARADRVSKLQVSVHSLVKLADDGNSETQADSGIYYIGADGYRHVFPNDKVYFTWFCDFSSVRIISSVELSSIGLGPNIIYRPGIKMVKFLSTPTVYAVQKGGVLRPISSEVLAASLYGLNWHQKVDDINDAFFSNYTFGEPINTLLDFNVSMQSSSVTFPSDNFSLIGYVQETSGTVLLCPIPLISSWPFSFTKTWRFTYDIYPGSTDATAVKYLQDFLKVQGPNIYPESIINGVYGPATTAAVKRFQAKYNIRQTGNLGVNTRTMINTIIENF